LTWGLVEIYPLQSRPLERKKKKKKKKGGPKIEWLILVLHNGHFTSVLAVLVGIRRNFWGKGISTWGYKHYVNREVGSGRGRQIFYCITRAWEKNLGK